MKRLKISSQSAADQQPIAESVPYAKRKTPNVRVERVLNSMVGGESLTKSLQDAGFNGSSSTLRKRFEPEGDLRIELAKRLKNNGVDEQLFVTKLYALIDAKKHLTIAGEAIKTEDNQAQLHALELLLQVLISAGLMPDKPQAASAPGPQLNVHIQLVGAQS